MKMVTSNSVAKPCTSKTAPFCTFRFPSVNGKNGSKPIQFIFGRSLFVLCKLRPMLTRIPVLPYSLNPFLAYETKQCKCCVSNSLKVLSYFAQCCRLSPTWSLQLQCAHVLNINVFVTILCRTFTLPFTPLLTCIVLYALLPSLCLNNQTPFCSTLRPYW